MYALGAPVLRRNMLQTLTVRACPVTPCIPETMGCVVRVLMQYRSDPMLQQAHRAKPWVVLWDDHEVANGVFLGGSEGEDPAEYADRRLAGLTAWHDYMGTNVTLDYLREDDGLDDIKRVFKLSDIATLYVTDQRHKRDGPPNNDALGLPVNLSDVQKVRGAGAACALVTPAASARTCWSGWVRLCCCVSLPASAGVEKTPKHVGKSARAESFIQQMRPLPWAIPADFWLSRVQARYEWGWPHQRPGSRNARPLLQVAVQEAWKSPNRTMLGKKQLAWLQREIEAHTPMST
eukprot:366359-Chlamydomonas_euryale.AAC.3